MANLDPATVQLESLIHAVQSNMSFIEVTSAFKWADIGWHVPSGVRADFEIKYVARGQIALQQAGLSIAGLPGDLFFLDNQKGHSCDHGTFTLFSFGFNVAQNVPEGKRLYEQIQAIFAKLPQKLKLDIHGRMIRRFNELNKEISVRSFGYEVNLKCLMVQLLIEVTRICLVIRSSASNITPYQYNKYTDLISDIIVYLQENAGEHIDLHELGGKYMLNPRYLNRIFKAATGFPIFRYHQMIKVEKAKKLLSTSGLNLLEIAMELGFESSQSFSKFYKKMTLITPSEYRKMLKESE